MVKIVAIDATAALMREAYALRHEVFVVEQGVAEELEIDEDDRRATHLVAVGESGVVGTLRMLRHDRTAKIGRMAVAASSRSKRIGKAVMEFAAIAASHDGVEEIVLAAQLAARKFYQRLGYVEEGDVFFDAHLPHVRMRKRLSSPAS
jgi:predicted GNAT family N-acyltransferase